MPPPVVSPFEFEIFCGIPGRDFLAGNNLNITQYEFLCRKLSVIPVAVQQRASQTQSFFVLGCAQACAITSSSFIVHLLITSHLDWQSRNVNAEEASEYRGGWPG